MKAHIQQGIEFTTRRELAARWLKSIETIKRMEKAGLLPAFKIGRDVRYRMADILAFEEGAKV